MSSPTAAAAMSRQQATAPRRIAPLFVCPGAKDTVIGHSVFPHGEGFSHLVKCPAREVCLWYAGHDLGGRDSYNDFPAVSLLPARFSVAPFSCADFKAFCGREHRAGKRRFQRVSTVVLILHFVAALATLALNAAHRRPVQPGAMPRWTRQVRSGASRRASKPARLER